MIFTSRFFGRIVELLDSSDLMGLSALDKEVLVRTYAEFEQSLARVRCNTTQLIYVDITQEDMALKCGVTRQTIAKVQYKLAQRDLIIIDDSRRSSHIYLNSEIREKYFAMVNCLEVAVKLNEMWDYDDLTRNNRDIADTIDLVFRYTADLVCNYSYDTIQISGQKIYVDDVIEVILRLRKHNVLAVSQRIHTLLKDVKNKFSYVITALYNDGLALPPYKPR